MATLRATNSAQNFKYSDDRTLGSSWETKPRFDNANGKRARCDLSPQKALSNPALSRSVVVGSGIRARSSLRFSYRVLVDTRTAVHVNVYRRILIRRGLRAVSNVALIGVCARAYIRVSACAFTTSSPVLIIA